MKYNKKTGLPIDILDDKTRECEKMTEAERLQKRIREVRNCISRDAGSSLMDLIEELVNLEIDLERECNK